jgi:hypothetical protein
VLAPTTEALDQTPATLEETIEPLDEATAALEQTTEAVEGAAQVLPRPAVPPLLDTVSPSGSLGLPGMAEGASEPLPSDPDPQETTVRSPAEGPAGEDPDAAAIPPQPGAAPPSLIGTAGAPPAAAMTGVGVQAAGLQPLSVLAADAARQFGLPLIVMIGVLVFLAAGGQLAPHDRKALARSFDDVGRSFS